MNTIENTLKKLSMLYEFNRKLHAFTTSTKDVIPILVETVQAPIVILDAAGTPIPPHL